MVSAPKQDRSRDGPTDEALDPNEIFIARRESPLLAKNHRRPSPPQTSAASARGPAIQLPDPVTLCSLCLLKQLSSAMEAALRTVLEATGVGFIHETGGGAGVRLREPRRPRKQEP